MKDVSTIYGAVFPEAEIDSLFSKLDALDEIYENGSSPQWFQKAVELLRESDDRFTYESKYYGEFSYAVFVIGINIKKMKDDETFGAFRKIVETNLSHLFKTDIPCSMFSLIDED